MREATKAVRSNPSLAFKINLVVRIIMYASFLQLMASCQEESVENIIYFKNNFIKYYQCIWWSGKLFIHVKVHYAVSVGKNTFK